MIARALPPPPKPQHRPAMSLIEQHDAKIIPADALIDRRSGKPKRIPKAVKHAIRLLATGEVTTVKAAAQRVGLTREWLSRSLGLPHVQVFYAQKTREIIAAGQMRAGARLLELIDADSSHVSLHASIHTLRIAGIAPPEGAGTQVNVNVQPGYVINLGPEAEAQGPTIEHESGGEQVEMGKE